MESLTIKATRHTPTIKFLLPSSIFEIKGKSLPENAVDFYEPVVKWLKRLKESGEFEGGEFHFNISYCNTSTSKVFYTILKAIRDLGTEENAVKIIWHYEAEDDDMEDQGIIFQEQIGQVMELAPFSDH